VAPMPGSRSRTTRWTTTQQRSARSHHRTRAGTGLAHRAFASCEHGIRRTCEVGSWPEVGHGRVGDSSGAGPRYRATDARVEGRSRMRTAARSSPTSRTEAVSRRHRRGSSTRPSRRCATGAEQASSRPHLCGLAHGTAQAVKLVAHSDVTNGLARQRARWRRPTTPRTKELGARRKHEAVGNVPLNSDTRRGRVQSPEAFGLRAPYWPLTVEATWETLVDTTMGRPYSHGAGHLAAPGDPVEYQVSCPKPVLVSMGGCITSALGR
jgi:hypothetical protein